MWRQGFPFPLSLKYPQNWGSSNSLSQGVYFLEIFKIQEDEIILPYVAVAERFLSIGWVPMS